MLACLPSIVGWIILWYANSVNMLYLSTMTMGLGLGFNDGPAYSYIGEVCEPRLRGIMSCVVNMACLIGILSTYGLGFVCHWKTVASLSALCPVLCLLLVAFVSSDSLTKSLPPPPPRPTAVRFLLLDTGKPDLAAVQRQEREGHERDLLAERLGGAARRGRRVPRAAVLL